MKPVDLGIFRVELENKIIIISHDTRGINDVRDRLVSKVTARLRV